MAVKTPPSRYSADWLDKLDGRSRVYQVLKQRHDNILSDLGGPEGMSYAQRALASRAVWLEYWIEQQERNLANGGDFDSGRYTQACNSLMGLLAKLGLKRQAKDITLADYIKQREASA
ncbi:hypothetical protein [Desulfurivibrio alkaliphilus]|uniref:Uncharacterized protein n=1 Tax=Desulfurivibrio alkaliphilus (strain DSM 19089 / UNIQEM U267 / AHT2) TaxID=589865 RepID=D6Z330_DESAT|nr:hypothetical protein [Desulfurivibrio alkaliphilus]ADH85955.1 conserved hypothetical protein [Desulfurivibrio alkaliphilus AHT 2]